MSFVSFTTVRNRMIESAPTRAKARLRLLPMTIITIATMAATKMIVRVKDWEYDRPLWVCRYTSATTRPKKIARPRLLTIS